MAGPKKPSLFGRILGGIGNWLRGAPAAPKLKPSPLTIETPKLEDVEAEQLEQLGGGHRGIAAGDLKNPNLSPENVAKWRLLGNESMAGFVYGAEPLFVHSSNVEMAQYFIDQEVMFVKFLERRGKKKTYPGGTYRVSPINEAEAIAFGKALSKGGYYWDVVRIRGTRRGHKKNVVKVR